MLLLPSLSNLRKSESKLRSGFLIYYLNELLLIESVFAFMLGRDLHSLSEPPAAKKCPQITPDSEKALLFHFILSSPPDLSHSPSLKSYFALHTSTK
jgi:hypothetical protein